MGNEFIDKPKIIDKEEARKQFDYYTKVLNLKHTFSFDEAWEFVMAKRKEVFRGNIVAFEEQLKQVPGCLGEDPFPLKHTFADGMYIRQITVPAKTLTVTKIHKTTHPFFILKGEVSILTEEGVKRIKAPYSGITKAGTKRIIWHHDEVVLTTVHATKETDLDKIESEIIAKSYSELGLENEVKLLSFIKSIPELEEAKC